MSTASSARGAVSQDPSSFVLRRVLPLIVIATIVAGVLRWLATERGLLPEAAGVALMTVFAVALGVGYSLWVARALRRSVATERDSLYRLLASNIPDGAVFLFDRDLRYILAEGTNFDEVALRREELEGHTIWEALEPEAAAAIEPSYRAALDGKSSSFEMEFRGHIYLVTVAPTYDDKGEIVGGLVH